MIQRSPRSLATATVKAQLQSTPALHTPYARFSGTGTWRPCASHAHKSGTATHPSSSLPNAMRMARPKKPSLPCAEIRNSSSSLYTCISWHGQSYRACSYQSGVPPPKHYPFLLGMPPSILPVGIPRMRGLKPPKRMAQCLGR